MKAPNSEKDDLLKHYGVYINAVLYNIWAEDPFWRETVLPRFWIRANKKADTPGWLRLAKVGVRWGSKGEDYYYVSANQGDEPDRYTRPYVKLRTSKSQKNEDYISFFMEPYKI